MFWLAKAFNSWTSVFQKSKLLCLWVSQENNNSCSLGEWPQGNPIPSYNHSCPISKARKLHNTPINIIDEQNQACSSVFSLVLSVLSFQVFRINETAVGDLLSTPLRVCETTSHCACLVCALPAASLSSSCCQLTFFGSSIHHCIPALSLCSRWSSPLHPIACNQGPHLKIVRGTAPLFMLWVIAVLCRAVCFCPMFPYFGSFQAYLKILENDINVYFSKSFCAERWRLFVLWNQIELDFPKIGVVSL